MKNFSVCVSCQYKLVNRSNNESIRCSTFWWESIDAATGRLGRGLTVDPRNGPVASDAARNAGQIEDEGPGVGFGVVVGRRDVDAVDVPAQALADLRLLWYECWRVVVNVYQVDLQRAGASGGWRTWGGGQSGGENSIKKSSAGAEQEATRGGKSPKRIKTPKNNLKTRKEESRWRERLIY